MATLSLARPTRAASPALVLAAAALYVLAWGGGLAWTHRAPPLDSAEQLVWSYALQGGYWKHPPLPSWILHALVAVFGPSVALPYFAAYACVAIALVLGWRLGCEFMSPQRSLLAMGLTALVGYHGINADAFNHDTVLLPFQAAMVLFFYLATRRGDWHLWALAGLSGGLALLVKYVALFPMAALLAYFVADRRVHTRRNVAGALLALGVAALLLEPHAIWLAAHEYLPFQYARAMTRPLPDIAAWLANLGSFLAMQLLRISPLLLALGWLARDGMRADGAPAPRPAPGDRLFLWIAGAGPFVLLLLYALLTRTPLVARWGSTSFLLAGWLALDALRQHRLPEGERAWRPVLALALASWMLAVVAAPWASEALHQRGRTRFPGAALAAHSHATWQALTGTPLRIVIGDTWLAGNVVAHGPPLAVMIDGEPAYAPWVTPEDVARCGALVLQDRSTGAPAVPPATRQWMAQAAEHGEWEIPWGDGADAAEPLRIAWGLLPPSPAGGCAR